MKNRTIFTAEALRAQRAAEESLAETVCGSGTPILMDVQVFSLRALRLRASAVRFES